MDDVNEKTADGYQILNLGSTTGALKQTVDGWFDAYDDVRPTGE
jgi:2-dehydro-3-deoxyglucarate aldolase